MTATNTWGASGLLSRRTGTTSQFYTFDPSGNLAQRLNSNGTVALTARVDAFGARTASASTTDPYSGLGGQFGYYTDSESGLLLLGHRYYSATTGRFVSRDPLGYGGGLNLYAFCGNNPVNESDPLGFCGGPEGGDGGEYGDGLSGLWPDRLKSWTNNTIPSGPSIPGVFNNPLDIVKGLLDLPSNVEHLGSRTGQHFGDPADYGWGGVGQDALTFTTVVTAGMGAAGGAGAGGTESSTLYVVDENLPPQLAALLEKEGVNAVSAERAFGGRGMQDEDMEPLLEDWGAKIITKNARDFDSDLQVTISTGNAAGRASQILESLRGTLPELK